MLMFLIIILFCCLYKTSIIKEKGSFCEQPLQLKNTVPLKGILAIEIVLGHTYGHLAENSLLYINNRIGVWIVGIFFFLSGYGLNLSFHKKKDYLHRFIVKRVGRIVLPFLIVFLINWFLDFDRNFWHFFINDWFITEIIIIYILWYIFYKYMSEKSACVVLTIFILLLNIFGVYYDIGSRWYGSTACFLFGIIFETLEEKIISYCRLYYVRVLSISTMLLISGGILFLIGENNKVIAVLLINVTCITLCIEIYLLLMKLSIGNIYTNFLGHISWEIYVSHRLFISIYEQKGWNDFLYMCILFGSIILMSWTLWILCDKCRRYHSLEERNGG